MSETTLTVDGRREAGERTRERLIEATLELLAEHGESSVSLRDITDAAGTNVAAVSYHFGSKDALVGAAIDQSIGRLVQQQVDALRALDDPTIEQIAAAWAHPVVSAVASSPCADQVFMRVVGRTLTTCTGERREQVTAQSAHANDELVAALRRVMPDRDESELRFRAAAVDSVLNHVTTGAAGLDGSPADEIERLLLPVVAGALAGGSS